jgi:hypothetical protein
MGTGSDQSTLSSNHNETIVSWLTLFTTSGTLICCALPILLVTLGMGASIAAMTSNFPLLITLSEHKNWVFLISGMMLLISGWLLFRPGRACPIEPSLAQSCMTANQWNKRIYWSSILIWSLGFFAAFLLLPLRLWLENTGVLT